MVNKTILLLILTGGLFWFSQTYGCLRERRIIVFKSGVSISSQESLIRKYSTAKIKNLWLINGQAILLTDQAAKKMAKEEIVIRIDEDPKVFKASSYYGLFPDIRFNQPAEQVNWGLQKIKATAVWNKTKGQSIKIAVLDTGIDLRHPDLKENIKGGYNATDPRKSIQDDNGHGTHVAGIIAAVDNKIGIIGAAPEADLYIVKVLDKFGEGYLSDVIDGLGWVVRRQGVRVINMSFGTRVDSISFREAVKKVDEFGTIQVAAAGNTKEFIDYPAAYAEVIAVGATDKDNSIPDWSAKGGKIDLLAPGVSIYSTYLNSGYKTRSGTSMSASYVSGVVALISSFTEVCDINKDGKCGISEIKQALKEASRNGVLSIGMAIR